MSSWEHGWPSAHGSDVSDGAWRPHETGAQAAAATTDPAARRPLLLFRVPYSYSIPYPVPCTLSCIKAYLYRT